MLGLNNKLSINKFRPVEQFSHQYFDKKLVNTAFNLHSDCFNFSNIAFGSAVCYEKKTRTKQLESEIYSALDSVSSGQEAKAVYENPELEGKIDEWLKIRLTKNKQRYEHSKGAEATSRKIANILGLDADKAALAALLHDNSKCLQDKTLIRKINKYKLFDPKFPAVNNFNYHGILGAYYAQNNLGIKDKIVLDSIKYHCQTRTDIGDYYLIMRIADVIEPVLRDKGLCEKIMDYLKQNKDNPQVLTEAHDMCCEFYKKLAKATSTMATA